MHTTRSSTRWLGWIGLLLAAFTGLACPSCRTASARAPRPVPEAARAAYERAATWLDARRPEERALARRELDAAVALAPEWIVPRRALDELARAELRAVAVLAEHRAALAKHPADPGELYLCGRLEGRAGALRFEEAVRADPGFAWGWHGLSFAAQQSGHRDEAIEHARKSVRLAGEPVERAFFVQNLARLLAGARRQDEAAELLAEELGRGDLGARERRALDVLAVSLGLETADFGLRGDAYDRGLELLGSSELTDADVAELGARLRTALSFDDDRGERLLLALSSGSSPARDRLRGEILLSAAPTPLALALLERGAAASGLEPSGPVIRAARFFARQYSLAVERWLADLPRVVLDEHGLPREPRLALVVERARTLESTRAHALDTASERAAALSDFGAALVDAGWFREARAVAAELAEHDLERALALDARALAGQEAIEGIVQVVVRADTTELFQSRAPRRPRSPAWEHLFGVSPRTRELGDLDALLAAFVAPLERARPLLGADTDLAAALRASPRLSFAPVGELVHPGPRFSAADEANGLGKRGEPVPGFAADVARLGRFALFGELAGAGGPDGTMLPCLYTEERRGEHLGVAWSGTIAWCEAAELKSRAGRAGAHISAAALHEGYWLDVDAVRSERAFWSDLRRAFAPAAAAPIAEAAEPRPAVAGDGARGAHEPDAAGESPSPSTALAAAAQRIDDVLAVRGLELRERDEAARTAERRSSAALLGEAQRVRLALLRDRARPGEVLGAVGIDELVAVTSAHEEGHLCDRTRFLPIWKHLGAVLAFALECGFSPQRIQEQLEYRAQLTCLAEAADPRIPLAQILDAAEGGGNGITPHAAGYARLLDDLLGVVDELAAKGDGAFARLDRERTLVHQLHALAPEDVRRAARELARRRLD